MSSIAATAAPARKLTMEPAHDARARKLMRSVSTHTKEPYFTFLGSIRELKIADFGSTGSSTALQER